MTSNKRFEVHNSAKSCANCGLWLYEDDEMIKSNSSYFHKDHRGCQDANDRLNKMIYPHKRKGVVIYG